jgi:hypothetical protein
MEKFVGKFHRNLLMKKIMSVFPFLFTKFLVLLLCLFYFIFL